MKNLYRCIAVVATLLVITLHSGAQITMTFPKATSYINTIPVGWSTSSPPASIQLVMTSRTTPTNIWTLTFSTSNTISSGSFSFSPLTMLTNTNFSSVSPATILPDGLYTVNLVYKRASDGNVFNSSSVTLTTDNTTLPPFIVLPVTNATVGAKFVIKDSMPDNPSLTAGTKKLKFAKGTDTTVLIMSSSSSRKDSFELNVNNLVGAPIVSASPTSLTEGVYDMTFEYKDASGHDSAVAVTKNITIDLHADPATITSPVSNSIVPNIFNLSFSLPEDAKSGSVRVAFTTSSSSDTLVLSTTTTGNHTVGIDGGTLSNSNSFVSSTLTSLTEGLPYVISLLYIDKAGNVAAPVSVSAVALDKHADAPSITAPATVSSFFDLQYSLPEAAAAGSVKLIIVKNGASDTAILSTTTAGTHTIHIDAQHIASSTGIASSTLPGFSQGNYTMKLVYTDNYLNVSPASATLNVAVDLSAAKPLITSPSSGAAVSSLFTIAYNIPEKPTANSVKLVFSSNGRDTLLTINDTTAGDHTLHFATNIDSLMTANPLITASTAASLADGEYLLKLIYMDENGNISPASDAIAITLITHADAPIIISPASDTAVHSGFSIKYTLPADVATDGLRFIFEKESKRDTLVFPGSTAGTYETPIIGNNVAKTVSLVKSTTGVLLDGQYILSISYVDKAGNTASASSSFEIQNDSVTQVPVFILPDSSLLDKDTVHIAFALPEDAQPHTVVLQFAGPDTLGILLKAAATGTYTYSIPGNKLNSGIGVQNASVDSLRKGNYSVTLAYLDAKGNPAASVRHNKYSFSYSDKTPADSVTQVPVFIYPDSSLVDKDTIHVAFVLPEDAQSHTVVLQLTGQDTVSIFLNASTAGAYTYALPGNALHANSGVLAASADSVPKGNYAVTLSYLDAKNNPPSSVTHHYYSFGYSNTMARDSVTQTPIFILPDSSLSDKDTVLIAFALPEAAQSHTVRLQFAGRDTINLMLNATAAGTYAFSMPGNNLRAGPAVFSASSDSLSAGAYSVTLSYSDAQNNPEQSVTHKRYSFRYSDSAKTDLPDTTSTPTPPSLEFDISELKGSLNNGKPDVYWKTIAEKNTSYYEVQQSSDSVSFTSIGQVTAANASSSDKEYHFVHQNASAGNNYYRLRMVDQNNASVYTPVVAVYKDRTLADFKVFPVPATNTINVAVLSPVANTSRVITLWDYTGRMIKRMKFNTVQGYNIFTIPLTGLASGTYILQDGDRVASFIKL